MVSRLLPSPGSPWPERHREIEDHCADFGVVLHCSRGDAYSASEALAYVEHKTGICLLPASSVANWPGIAVKPLSTHVLARRCGVFIREDSRSPLLQKLIEASLQQANALRLKRGPCIHYAPHRGKEGFQKVKGVS